MREREDYREKTERKIGILGGTFNPPHNGHLWMATNAYSEYALDEVIFLPTGHTAYKKYAGEEMREHRYRMLERLIGEDPRFSISREEMDAQEIRYTYQTLEEMRKRQPYAELYFILGGDSLCDLSTWRYPERICESAVILAAARKELRGERLAQKMEELRERYGADIRFLAMPAFASSSEEIRARVQAGENVCDVVPSAVLEYMDQNGLYQSG